MIAHGLTGSGEGKENGHRIRKDSPGLESRCAAEILSGPATIIWNLKSQATFKRMGTPRGGPSERESRR